MIPVVVFFMLNSYFSAINCSFKGGILIAGISLFLSVNTQSARIGIFGCSHGDIGILSDMACLMKELGVTHIIANGDFVDIDPKFRTEAGALDKIQLHDSQTLNLEIVENTFLLLYSALPDSLQKDAAALKDRLFVMPGNWDHNEAGPQRVVNRLFSEYAHLIASRYYHAGIISIEGHKIQVAHFPQHPLPAKFLPSAEFIYRPWKGQAHIIETMSRMINHLGDVSLNISGHTHIHTYVYDESSGVLTYGPGGLTDRKSPSEHKAFGIYDTETRLVSTYSLEDATRGQVIGRFAANMLEAPENLFGQLTPVPVANLNNMAITRLDHDKASACLCAGVKNVSKKAMRQLQRLKLPPNQPLQCFPCL